MSSGDNDYTEENINTIGFDFKKYGFHIKSISDMNYSMFLYYKIECKYHENDISDQLFPLSAISNKAEPLKNFKVIIEDEKLKYLYRKKTGSMKAGNFLNLDKSEIEKILINKIENNYIYNMEYFEEHNTIKFNIIIEMENHFKYLVSLEYLPNDMELRLITMF
jgi:hypothetical protein